jgi:LmbE family N-acetylglucosaminyl deacetylase
MTAVFIAPHHDDETLFGTFTLLREKPLVVVVYDGGPEREAETNAAMEILGCPVEHWRLPTDIDVLTLTDWFVGLVGPADRLFAPMWEAEGQPQHNTVSNAIANHRAGREVTWYATYTPSGKTVTDDPVPFEREWIGLKLRALACYPSQYAHPSHAPHFLRDQTEYVASSPR